MATIAQSCVDDGTSSFRVKIRLSGHQPVTGTFARITDAKRWAQATEAATREGHYFKTAEAKRHTLADLADRYVLEVLPYKLKNSANTNHHLGWWKSKLGQHTLDEITAAQIMQCRNDLLATNTRRKRPMAPATVVRYLAALAHGKRSANPILAPSPALC